MDKKGFCEDNLTKQTHFSQETLTGSGQETLTKQMGALRSSFFETYKKPC